MSVRLKQPLSGQFLTRAEDIIAGQDLAGGNPRTAVSFFFSLSQTVMWAHVISVRLEVMEDLLSSWKTFRLNLLVIFQTIWIMEHYTLRENAWGAQTRHVVVRVFETPSSETDTSCKYIEHNNQTHSEGSAPPCLRRHCFHSIATTPNCLSWNLIPGHSQTKIMPHHIGHRPLW